MSICDTPDTLPDTLWELLAVARSDALAIARDPRYALNMGAWHTPSGITCHVCLAGAVMARSLQAPRDARLSPGSYYTVETDALDRKLGAINMVREGMYTAALLYLHPALDQDAPKIKLLLERIALLIDSPYLEGSPSAADIEEFFAHPKLVKFLSLLKEHNF